MKDLQILLAGDIHYVSQTSYQCAYPERKTSLGLEFLQQALYRVSKKEKIDALVILGDCVDCGDFIIDLENLKKELEKLPIPSIVVRGNHDPEEKIFKKIMKNFTGPLIMNSFALYPFYDRYMEDDKCIREKKEIEQFEKFCKNNPDKKPIVFQHSVVHPRIENSYPYNIENGEEIIASYKKYGVCLSVSGHYHPGVESADREGITFFTLPALCVNPFSCALVKINEKTEIKKEQLFLRETLKDYHCHTEFAYCAEDIKVIKAIEKAKILGLSQITFTEHCDQLYLPEASYWGGNFLYDTKIIKEQRKNKKDRMDAFRNYLFPLRSKGVKIGLEVECYYKDGKLAILEEDRKGIDYLIGAVHFLPSEDTKSKKTEEKSFMRLSEALCRQKIDIMAHPFRYFRRSNSKIPINLYKPMVEMLKEYKVAAELNFHANEPDPAFFEKCLEAGIKISLGTDAHTMYEVGELSPHLDFLKNKLKIKDLKSVLFEK